MRSNEQIIREATEMPDLSIEAISNTGIVSAVARERLIFMAEYYKWYNSLSKWQKFKVWLLWDKKWKFWKHGKA